MKIKALKTFVSGRFSASRGEVLDVPGYTGQKLVAIGLAESQETPEDDNEPVDDTGLEDDTEPEDDNEPVAPKKKGSAGKSGAKTSASK